MKSILISIHAEWVAKILNGEKTIEIRKTAPKCKLPVDVYIYCTKEGTNIEKDCGLGFPEPINGKVVAKFTLNKIERVVSCIAKDWGDDPWEMRYSLRLEESDAPNLDDQLMYKGGFESEWTNPVYEYLGFNFPTIKPDFGKRPDFKEGIVYGYAWHISDLVIFDEPKDLWQFQKPGTHERYLRLLEAARKDDFKLCEKYGFDQWDMREENVIANTEELTEEAYKMGAYGLRRPPQSWLYVEEKE